MKLAVCAQEEGLNAVTDSRFGRCAYFVVVDPADGSVVQSLRNEGVEASGGAGPKAAQLLSDAGVDAVVVGNLGPKAQTALKAAGIEVYGGLAGTVEATVEKYNQGNLGKMAGANVPEHSGM